MTKTKTTGPDQFNWTDGCMGMGSADELYEMKAEIEAAGLTARITWRDGTERSGKIQATKS